MTTRTLKTKMKKKITEIDYRCMIPDYQRVSLLMLDGQWYSPRQVANMMGLTKTKALRTIKSLAKIEHGGYVVALRSAPQGSPEPFMYRITGKKDRLAEIVA